jgi:hypothetical protein
MSSVSVFVEIITPFFLDSETLSEVKIKPGVKKHLYCYGERCMEFRQVLKSI